MPAPDDDDDDDDDSPSEENVFAPYMAFDSPFQTAQGVLSSAEPIAQTQPSALVRPTARREPLDLQTGGSDDGPTKTHDDESDQRADDSVPLLQSLSIAEGTC